MKYEEHCLHCKELLGEEFGYVHSWLDEFFNSEKYRTKHRFLRHHRAGMEEVRRMWGDRAAEAAKIHLIDDLQGERMGAGEDEIAEDETDYKKRGYW